MMNLDALRPLYGKRRIKKFAVLDLESKADDTQTAGFTRVFLAGFFDGSSYREFRNDDDRVFNLAWYDKSSADGGCIDLLMRIILVREYKGFYIYAHNGGSFDFCHLTSWLKLHVDTYESSIGLTGSSILMMKIRHKRHGWTWTFLDSLRIMPMGLNAAAKSLGLEGKLDHDLNRLESSPAWSEYLRQDCELLYQIVHKFQTMLYDTFKGELCVTLPSVAMALYRRRYMGHERTTSIVMRHRHWSTCKDTECLGCLHAFIRSGYRGGRVEGFRKGGKNLYYYDANSSYPFAMLEPMPTGEKQEFGKNTRRETHDRLHAVAVGFLECTVSIPTTCYLPPLPWREPKTEKLLFPVGTFSGVWSYDELLLLDHPSVGGRIVSVKRSVWYRKKSMFPMFVACLYGYRDKSKPDYDEGLSLMAKLMMNSLYGKFAMREEREAIEFMSEGGVPDGARLLTDPKIEGWPKVYAIPKRSKATYIVPQVSAQITTLARIHLWKALERTRAMGGDVIYCDTDSIITSLEDFPVGVDLGQWKNEFPGEILEEVRIVGPKVYWLKKKKAFKGDHVPGCKEKGCTGCQRVKVTMKGVPRDLRTEENLRRLAAGETLHYERLERVGGLARKNFATTPRMIPAQKTFLGGKGKRAELPGGETRPWVIVDGEPT